MEVRLHIGGYADSDAQERADLAWRLESELRDRDLDLETVDRPSARLPAGAKGTALEWAQLVVTFAGALPSLVTAVLGWTQRHPGASVTLEIDGDKITVDDATAEERRELIATWLERHGGR